MLLGAGIGLLSIGVWALEVRRLNFPDWMIRLAMVKLAFVASVALMAAGAVVGRHAKTRTIPGEPAASQLGEGEAEAPMNRMRTPRGVERRSDTPR